MDVEAETTQRKEGAKGAANETKSKVSTEPKDTTKGSTGTTKEGATNIIQQEHSGPKAMDQAKAAKTKEATAN